jgi:flagellar motor protein MotB
LDLEAALRASRPEPRSEFVRMVTARIDESRPHRVALRLAFAAALTLMLASALLAFGGIGYAGAAVQQVGKLAQSLNPQQQRGDDPGDPGDEEREDEDEGEPDDDQYKEERKQCRRAEHQRHADVRRDIRQDYAQCQREEKARHREAVRACEGDRDCLGAEKERHRAEVRRCKEERRRREEEERDRHRAALRSCNEIGR